MQTHSIKKKTLLMNDRPAVELITCFQSHNFSLYPAEHQLFFMIEGSIIMTYGKMNTVVEKGQMVYVRKGILVECLAGITGDSAKVEYMVFSFEFEVLQEFTTLTKLNGSAKENLPVVLCNNMDLRMQRYAESFQSYFIDPEKVKGSFIKIKLFEMLFSLSGYDDRLLEQLLTLGNDYRCDITRVVEENLMNGLSINEIARLSGRSLSSFRRDFLAVYNSTPGQWIREKRMEKAAELLLCTSMSITNICYTVGLESIAHFSRVFKAHFGYPPSKLRMNVEVA